MNEPLQKSIRLWGMWCHLSGLAGIVIGIIVPIPFLGVLVPYSVWQIGRDRHPFIDEQGRAATNFQISMSIYLVVAVILWLFLSLTTCALLMSTSNTIANIFAWFFYLGLATLVLFGVFQLCVIILAATKAYRGQSYQYPFLLRFLQ